MGTFGNESRARVGRMLRNSRPRARMILCQIMTGNIFILHKPLGTGVLRYWGIGVLRYCGTAVLECRGTVVLEYFSIVVLGYCRTVVLWYLSTGVPRCAASGRFVSVAGSCTPACSVSDLQHARVKACHQTASRTRYSQNVTGQQTATPI